MNQPIDEQEHLKVAQACFMEWIKELEYELSRANDFLKSAETALRSGNASDFGEGFGSAHGCVCNALQMVRNATKTGFPEDL